MKENNHYEVAFESYLRDRGAATLPVVEARRSYLDDDSVKSPDFLVVSAAAARLVVDVKGRKFGGTPGKPRGIWQNWCERDSVGSLERWAAHFGAGFRGVLAFVYQLPPEVELPRGTPDLFPFRGAIYLVRGVEVTAYRAAMRTRSPRWDTVHLPTAAFRAIVKPFSWFLANGRRQPAGVREGEPPGEPTTPAARQEPRPPGTLHQPADAGRSPAVSRQSP